MRRNDPPPPAMCTGYIHVDAAGASALILRPDGTVWRSASVAVPQWARVEAERAHPLENIEWVMDREWQARTSLYAARQTAQLSPGASAAQLAWAKTSLIGAELVMAIANRSRMDGPLRGAECRVADGTDGAGLELDVRGTLYRVSITPAIVKAGRS